MATTKDFVRELGEPAKVPRVTALVGGLHGALFCLDTAGRIFTLVEDEREPIFMRKRVWKEIAGPHPIEE